MVHTTRARAILGTLMKFVPGAFRGEWAFADPHDLSGRTKEDEMKELKFELPVDPADIERVLTRYGIAGNVKDYRIGTAVTTFEIKVKAGTRLGTLEKYREDLARDLQCPSLRIIKSVRDSSLIGIEVANDERFTVYFKDLLEDMPRNMRLPVAMGEDTYGDNMYIDLTETPHMLVAGQTGSGKSVFLNTVIGSLLMTRTPDQVRFLIVDPKQVEFVAYEGVPHLERPIASDPDEAMELLDYAVDEMDRRFELLRNRRVKKLKDYNTRVPERERLPYMVFIVDEFSDLMMSGTRKDSKVVESKVVRIAQKARAVGIHMILATQKPLASVMTSLIKANMPARAAFSVSSSVDSRVILDENGAEALTGKGDMLYRDPNACSDYERIRRVQAPWLSDADIDIIVGG
ncbi:MAG: DUF87 domain-containing protein [Candidatus Altiarchaeales archaeon]|nr:DUF87 domain-containing protein [Candidatus Altiarchaeales archaeon]